MINRASKILRILEKLDVSKTENKDLIIREDSSQLTFFDKRPSEVEEEIKGIDILNITPIEAMNILYRLVEKSRRDEDM